MDDWFTRCLDGTVVDEEFVCFGCDKKKKAGSETWGLELHGENFGGLVLFCTCACRNRYIDRATKEKAG